MTVDYHVTKIIALLLLLYATQHHVGKSMKELLFLSSFFRRPVSVFSLPELFIVCIFSASVVCRDLERPEKN